MKKKNIYIVMVIILFAFFDTFQIVVKADTLPNIIWLDYPNVSNISSAKIEVSGWALNSSGIQVVKVYIDSNLQGDATMGQARPDVNNAFPGYINGNNSGFSYSIDSTSIKPGVHILRVIAVGTNNTQQVFDKSIEIMKPPPRMFIDCPQNPELNSDFNISGWALNASGIKNISVNVDGNLQGSAIIGQVRPDVDKAFPGYPDGSKSGYSFIENIKNISGGAHTLKITATGNDGTIQEISKAINVVKLPSLGNLEEPSQNLQTKEIRVSGWALNASSIQQIKVYVDGSLNGNASLGGGRPDIPSVFQGYPNESTSGFFYLVNPIGMQPGNHQISAEVIGVDGSNQVFSKTVQFLKLPNKFNIEEPNAVLSDNKNFNISGWMLDSYGTKAFNIYIDNKLKGTANRIRRTDVNSIFPEYYDGANSGFNLPIDINNVSPGIHVVKIEEINNNGESNVITKNIEVKKPSPLQVIDTPTQMQLVTSSKMNISGWAVNASGVNTIQMLLDGHAIGNAQPNIVRSDVYGAFPNYVNSMNSGYSFDMDITSVQPGKHTITINVLGNDGSSSNYSKDFVFKGIYTFTQYNNPLDYYVNIQMTNGSPLVYNSAVDQRAATFDEVKNYMNPSNYQFDDYGKYMFMKLTYSDGISAADLNKALNGKGVLSGKGDVFLKAGQMYNINPIYLVAHALLETGNGTSNLATGKIIVSALHTRVQNPDNTVTSVFSSNVTPKAVYDMYGIGAYDDNPDLWGSEMAYKQGWFDVDTAIIQGAQWIGQGYITSSVNHQDTIYKMRWNLSNVYHQYATDIGWASKQVNMIKLLVDKMTNPILYYEVPVFNK